MWNFRCSCDFIFYKVIMMKLLSVHSEMTVSTSQGDCWLISFVHWFKGRLAFTSFPCSLVELFFPFILLYQFASMFIACWVFKCGLGATKYGLMNAFIRTSCKITFSNHKITLITQVLHGRPGFYDTGSLVFCYKAPSNLMRALFRFITCRLKELFEK